MHTLRFALALFLLYTPFCVPAQNDTLRYRHSFRLPVKTQQPGYEKKVSQYPSNVHSFVFRSPDSCTTYIVIRSENDSLDIELDNTRKIKLKSRKEKEYTYSLAEELLPGEHVFVIRTRKYSSYSVYVKGQPQ